MDFHLIRRCRMSQRRSLLLVLITVTALTLSVVAPGAAVTPTREDISFGTFTVEEICSFPVKIEALTDGETLTKFFDPEGNVVMELTTGPLRVRVTNLDTGESIELNVSGPGRLVIDEGQATFTQEGPWLTFVFPGAFEDDPNFEPGLYFTRGTVVAEFDPETGAFLTYTAITKNRTNLCEVLAD
jgi:hypothetical protein